MSVTINIAGDFCITPAYIGKNLLTDEIKALYEKTDVNIVNLECPVNKHGDNYKIFKHGPHLQTTEKIIDYLQQLNITAVTLANNHILDYGEKGVETTIEACNKNNILTVGAGKNSTEAADYISIKKNNLNIAIINFCEHEWSIASNNTAGANPIDVIDNLSAIKKAKQSADAVIVIVHGGNEYYNLPRPGIKKLFRFFAENGADAIISHHTHTISGYEVYNNVPIIYGTGNMLFTRNNEHSCWYTGLSVHLTVDSNKPIQFNIIPTRQTKENFELTIATGQEKEDIIKETEQLSAIIANDAQLQNEWEMLVEKRQYQYLYQFSPVPAMPGKYVKSALRRMGFVNTLTPPEYLSGVINYITCESHLELTIQALKKKILKK